MEKVRTPRGPCACLVAGLGLVGFLAGCGGGGGGGGFAGPVGVELAKPGGGTFFLDQHRSGQASRIHLLEVVWGRLVDVHALLPSGAVDGEPVFRDLLIDESVQTDGQNYRLETNPITLRTRLVVLRTRGVTTPGSASFDELLARARSGLAPVVPRGEDGSGSGPYSFAARNACLSLRFDDLLDDGQESRLLLDRLVRLLVGYPPDEPFASRTVFDPNHGGIAGGEFHSTRVLIDLAISEEEAASSEVQLAVNTVGLPPSALDDTRANASVHVPTRPDIGTGLFRVLTNLDGGPLDSRNNGPTDASSPTLDLVRAFRAGRDDDANSGFLLDLNPPELVGSFGLSVESAANVPDGTPGVDLQLDVRFRSSCRRAPRVADVIQVGEHFLEVQAAAPTPDPSGFVGDVRVRLVAAEPLDSPTQVLGNAVFLSTYSTGLPISFACWANVTPFPGSPPDRDISPASEFTVHFSEPMNPASVDPFETLRLVRGNAGSPLLPTTLVVAEALGSADLRSFVLRPLVPLASGVTGEYRIDIVGGAHGLTDLAGNPIAVVPGSPEFTLDPSQTTEPNGGIVLRFESTDELEPIGLPDLRGQFLYDFGAGTIRGRAPDSESFPADRSQPVPSIMIPFGPGVQTPLSGLGSKLQYVWRHCDLGWTVEDESKHNLDVTGIDWTPVGGSVLNDFFPRFEMRLSHSRRLPDEFRTFVGTETPCSGLGAGSNVCPPCFTFVPFEDNILVDPRSPQKVVHDRSLGYRVAARDLFVSGSGRIMLPFPMNRAGGPFTTFTWRDTAVLAKDGEDSAGIPLKIETAAPLGLVPGPPGRIALPGHVPAWGLPLLVEIRCFASPSSLGLNPLEIYLAQNAQALPNFRAYSTGGTNESGVAVVVDPDLTLFPEGGYNPGSRPPGQPTLFQADNSFYAGQLETVVRLSRAHSVWFDVGFGDPHFLPPVQTPRPSEQPGTARVDLEFRGADGFAGTDAESVFDARELDPLGDVSRGTVLFHGDEIWHADPSELDGARYLQVRFTFVNDIAARTTPRLSALGIAYTAR